MSVIIMGPPGAGKGTQSKLIEERHGYKHISTGDLIREGKDEDSPLGEYLRATLGDGLLIDSETVANLLSNEIARSSEEHFVFDGFPRALDQIPMFEAICDEHGIKVDFVIYLDVPEERLMDRLTKRRVNTETGEIYHLDTNPPPDDVDPEKILHRKDDYPDVVRTRIQEYHSKTEPVLEYYQRKGMVYMINGRGSDEKVYSIVEMAFQTDNIVRLLEKAKSMF